MSSLNLTEGVISVIVDHEDAPGLAGSRQSG